MLNVKNLSELPAVARHILKDTEGETIYCLWGEMGAGKTTLIKSFCEILGSKDVVNSPTFSIVNEYGGKNGKSIFHFDFYRIERLEELYDIGFEEYIDSGNYCFMEWPEKVMELLPRTYVYISIEVTNLGERLISYRVHRGNL